jgi:hypothetical protein
MKSAFSAVLGLFLGASPLAAQTQTDLGPIHRAIAHETSRLALEQRENHSDSAWRRAVALGAGKQMNVTDREGRVLTGYVAIGGDASLLVVRPDGAPIPAEALRALKTLAAQHTEYFSDARRNGAVYVLGDSTRIEAAGIFVGDQKVAELDAVVATIACADVRKIAITEYRSSPGWVAAGTAGGVFAGLLTSLALAYQPCGGSCNDEVALMWTGLIGFPVLGGYGAYRATRHEVERVAYVAP